MAWPKGKPRPPDSGRKRGTPNKNTQSLMEKCEAMGIDLFEALLLECQSEDPVHRLHAIKEACQYIFPKRKALEVDATVDMHVVRQVKEMEEKTPQELKAIIEEELQKIK